MGQGNWFQYLPEPIYLVGGKFLIYKNNFWQKVSSLMKRKLLKKRLYNI